MSVEKDVQGPKPAVIHDLGLIHGLVEESTDGWGNMRARRLRELMGLADMFLREMSRLYGLKSIHRRRAKSALLELLQNMVRYAGDLNHCQVSVAYCQPSSVMIVLQNASTEYEASIAFQRLTETYEAWRQGSEGIRNLRELLMDNPNRGGLGIWFLITQLKCDLSFDYDKENDWFRVSCVIG